MQVESVTEIRTLRFQSVSSDSSTVLCGFKYT